MKLPGLIVAPLTPFDKQTLAVDWKALEREIDYICDDCKAAMISVSGVETSEYHYLSFEGRKARGMRVNGEYINTIAMSLLV